MTLCTIVVEETFLSYVYFVLSFPKCLQFQSGVNSQMAGLTMGGQDSFGFSGSSGLPQPHPSTVGGTTTLGYSQTPMSQNYGYQMGYPQYSTSDNSGQYFPSTHGVMDSSVMPNRSSPAMPMSSKLLFFLSPIFHFRFNEQMF